MNKKKIATSFVDDYMFIINNKLSIKTKLDYNSDITTKAASLDNAVKFSIDSFTKIDNNSNKLENKIIEFEAILNTLDHWIDFYNALYFKYTLNVTTSKNGFKYYQLKGAVTAINGKKIWVNFSLGTENNVLKKFKTINTESLIEMNANEMIWKAYKKLREIREKKD